MTDETTPELTPELQEELEEVAKVTKRGFDIRARVMDKRGLRKSTITLYLDAEVGDKLGYAHDVYDTFGIRQGRDRKGVIGDIDLLQTTKGHTLDAYAEALKAARAMVPDGNKDEVDTLIPEPDFTETDAKIAELEKKKEVLLEQLRGTGIKVSMQAVPPKILKDLKRRARATLKITEKGIPANLDEEYKLAHTAHLMTVMFNTVTEMETGAVNDETTVDDGLALMDYLPPSQWARLDQEIGRVQYTDAISRDIESQEDFS